MKPFLQKNQRLLFYCAWLVLAFSQAASTELIADEAYYWVYSKYLSWGYFDHPPMIALLIKCGYSFFHNELGVRLLCVLLSTGTVYLTEKLTERKNSFLFYSIVLSLGILQIAGFLAVPDTPLLFFTALFFYCYRLYTNNINWKNALLLGITTTLLFYTKYHGVLIVIFSLLSNIKLLTRKQTWLAGIAVLILFAPHLLWQWENNWVSIRYHLFESNVDEYKISYTTDYILIQLLLAGPFAGLLLIPAALIYKTKNETEKALKFTMIGVYLFFLVSSFRGKVEGNWTLPVLIPLIVLSHKYIEERFSLLKIIRIVFIVSLPLILAVRIYLATDLGPQNSLIGRFRHHKEWAKAITDKTGNTPVVFYSSYQRASLYWFYSGKPSHSHNALDERRNNYDFWPTEDQLLGTPVYMAGTHRISSFTDSIQTAKGWLGIYLDTSYSALGSIKFIPEKINFLNGKLNVIFKREMSRWYFSFLISNPELKTELLIGIFKGKNLVKEIYTGIKIQQLTEARDYNFLTNLLDLAAGNYNLRFAIVSKDYPPTHNSDKFDLIIP